MNGIDGRNTLCNIESETYLDNDFSIPCDGERRYFLEIMGGDKCSESIVSIRNITRPPATCTMTLIIEKNDGTIISRVVPPPIQVFNSNAIAIAVNGLKSVSVKCEGLPENTCQGQITVSQQVCECLSCHTCSMKMKRKCKGRSIEQEECSLQGLQLSPSFPSFFEQNCNGTTRTVYEDLSDRESVTQITVSNLEVSGSEECMMTAIIETMDGRITTEIIEGREAFLVDNIRSLSITCTGDPDGICRGQFTGQKQFCLCC
ncbi:hypothetical protein ACFQWC_13315 [Rossellomorea sp. GCM10028870]|uniref:hypothetical protein n=1 Tax=Rossellomorea sp. GCM10028870 TaxID=3273426 RepID=UPI00361BA3DD